MYDFSEGCDRHGQFPTLLLNWKNGSTHIVFVFQLHTFIKRNILRHGILGTAWERCWNQMSTLTHRHWNEIPTLTHFCLAVSFHLSSPCLCLALCFVLACPCPLWFLRWVRQGKYKSMFCSTLQVTFLCFYNRNFFYCMQFYHFYNR